MWYRMEHNSAMRENEIIPFTAAWIDLETIILTEVRQISYDITDT